MWTFGFQGSGNGSLVFKNQPFVIFCYSSKVFISEQDMLLDEASVICSINTSELLDEYLESLVAGCVFATCHLDDAEEWSG